MLGRIAVALLADWAGRGSRTARWVIGIVYAVLGIMMASNIIAIRVIGGPVGKTLLAQADWFRSFTPISAILSAMTAENLVLLGAAVAALILLPLALRPLLKRILQNRLSALILWTGLVIITAGYAQTDPIERPTRTAKRVANPTVALVNSLLKPPPMDILAIAPGAVPRGEIQPEIPLGEAPPPSTIIIVVLESTGADAAYGESQVKQAGLMPNLARIAGQGQIQRDLFARLGIDIGGHRDSIRPAAAISAKYRSERPCAAEARIASGGRRLAHSVPHIGRFGVSRFRSLSARTRFQRSGGYDCRWLRYRTGAG